MQDDLQSLVTLSSNTHKYIMFTYICRTILYGVFYLWCYCNLARLAEPAGTNAGFYEYFISISLNTILLSTQGVANIQIFYNFILKICTLIMAFNKTSILAGLLGKHWQRENLKTHFLLRPHASLPPLYCMPALCPWLGAALILAIPAVDNEPTKNTRFGSPHDYMRLGGTFKHKP